jgi:hypothetical protein
MQRGKNGSFWRRIPGSYICVQALFVLFFLYAVRAGCASDPQGGAHPAGRRG